MVLFWLIMELLVNNKGKNMIYNKVTPKITVLGPGETYNPKNSGAFQQGGKTQTSKPSEFMQTKYKELGKKK